MGRCRYRAGYSATWSPLTDAETTGWKDATPRRWDLHGAKSLETEGILIGGCIELLAGIVGTPYGDVPAFGKTQGPLIAYLEAAEESAFNICRYLHQMCYAGWFDNAVAVLIGSTNAPAGGGAGGLTQRDAVLDSLGDLHLPTWKSGTSRHICPSTTAPARSSASRKQNTPSPRVGKCKTKTDDGSLLVPAEGSCYALRASWCAAAMTAVQASAGTRLWR